MAAKRYAYGVDLGGTKIKVALVDETGAVLEVKQVPTHAETGADAVQKTIIDTIKSIKCVVPPAGIGVGAPGQIDRDTGAVLFAPNLYWKDVPLKANLSKALSCFVAITDDVRAATIAEWHFGEGKGCKDFVCMFIGTGVGGGIVTNGRLVEGSSNTAGEIGHMIVERGGPKCTCGSFGCLEAIAGGWAIAKAAQDALKQNPSASKLLLEKCSGKIDSINGKMVTEAALEHDQVAEMVIRRAEDALIAGCVNIVNILNPARIILGGGILKGMPDLIPILKQGIKKFALPSAQTKLQILPASMTQDAGALGAALYVFDSLDGVL